MKKSLEETTREKPRLNKYLQELINKADVIKENIQNIENAITALYTEQENARRLRDLNLRRGKVIGRISLFLESIDFTEDKSIDDKINTLN